MWIKPHSEELHNLYSSSDIIKVNKSRRMRWTENVARMRALRNSCKILVRKVEEQTLQWSYLGDLGVDGMIILKRILMKHGVNCIQLG
jgi:hypothetical protein